MVQYIDKDAVVAKIKKLIRENELYLSENVSDIVTFNKTSAYSVLNDLLHFLDTIEVKEVDLEKEATHYLLHKHISPLNEIFHQTDIKVEMRYHKDIENAFKSGFELGLKSQKGE